MIKKSEEFNRARSKGKTFRNKQFTMNRCPNGLQYSRFGFIITKKVGKATVRNKLRRRLKALVRERLDSIEKGFDFVIVPRPQTSELSFMELEKNLDHIFYTTKAEVKRR